MRIIHTGYFISRISSAGVLLTAALLLGAGFLYQHHITRSDSYSRQTVALPLKLGTFPVELNGWSGKDIEVPEMIQRVANNDDFLNRLYTSKSGQWANVYIAYSGNPRTMVGHRPEVCYVSGGWIHNSSVKGTFKTASGMEIPYRLHNFSKPVSYHKSIFVMNYYILNGQPTNDESGFSGLSWRTPNIAGNSARYVAQVQISSVLENSVIAAGRDLSEKILRYLPDENGIVKAAQTEKRKVLRSDTVGLN